MINFHRGESFAKDLNFLTGFILMSIAQKGIVFLSKGPVLDTKILIVYEW